MNFKKIIFVLFLTLMIQFVFSFTVLAAETIPLEPSVDIPGVNGDTWKGVSDVDDGGSNSAGNSVAGGITITGDFSALTEYISRIYRFGLSVTGILAVIVLALGGITWLTAGGNANQISKAKQYIWGSITGLVLALLSYTLLNMVNPEIVKLTRPPAITILSEVTKGCGWQKTVCDLRFQKEQTPTECGKQPLLNGKPDGSYTHCCCGATDKDPAFVSGSAECVKVLGDKAFVSSYGPIESLDEFSDGVNTDLKDKCDKDCLTKGGTMLFAKINAGSQEFGCCLCNFDVDQSSGLYECQDNVDCNFLESDGVDYSCWMENNTITKKKGVCKPCVATGGYCSGALTANWQCCSGDCLAKAGNDVCK